MKNQLVRQFWQLLGTFFMIAALIQCSSVEPGADTAEGVFAQGEKAFEKENYLNALDKFRMVKNRFPYSSKAVEAELRIADTYFAQESYIEAEAAYEIFREMHPSHKRIDYVQYRIGLSFYKQIPGNTARDLTAAHRAIDAFETLIAKFPSSKYLKKAEEHYKLAQKKLAEHEDYVANFYYQREHYLSASYRYATLLKTYGGLGYNETSLFRLGECYFRVQMYSNSRDALQRLLTDFPNSKYKGRAGTLLAKMGGELKP